MFGLHLLTWFFIGLWLFIFVRLKLQYPDSQMLHWRLIHLLGTSLVFLGFFVEPWIEFDFLAYIDPTPELIRSLIPGELISKLIRLFGISWFDNIIHWFSAFTSLNGVSIHFLPTLGVMTWIITWVPLVPLVISIPIIGIGLKFPGKNISKWGGRFLLVTSLFSAISLLFLLPHLDAAGAENNFQLSLFATIMGTHLGIGIWVCIVGLMLTGFGGIIEISEKSNNEIDSGWDEHE